MNRLSSSVSAPMPPPWAPTGISDRSSAESQRWLSRLATAEQLAPSTAPATTSLAASRATGAAVRVDVTPGDPTDALFELAAGVDLVVTGSGRSGPAGRVSLGKTGSALLDGAVEHYRADLVGG